MFHVEHFLSNEPSPRQHSCLGRRLKTRHRRVFLTPRRETFTVFSSFLLKTPAVLGIIGNTDFLQRKKDDPWLKGSPL